MNMNFNDLRGEIRAAPIGTLKINVGASGIGKSGSIRTKMADIVKGLNSEGLDLSFDGKFDGSHVGIVTKK